MRRLRFLLIATLIGLVACTPGTIQPVSTSTASPPTPLAEPPALTSSPTQPTPPRVLVISQGSPWQERVTNWLQTRLTAQGWQIEIRPNLQAADLETGVVGVMLLPPLADYSNLIAQHPDLRFIFIGNAPLLDAPNMTQVILPAERLYFLAGYLSVLIAPDFRAGGLFPPNSETTQQAFRNGAYYLCGRCVPAYGPITTFPVMANLSINASVEEWQGALTELNKNRLETLFVSPEVLTPELQDHLAASSWGILTAEPPQDSPPDWAVTLTFDLEQGLETAWQAAIEQKQSTTVIAPLKLQNINSQWLTPGRQRMAEQVLQDLQKGWIYPLTPP
ncbi:hypothetical protein [uncultured Thermanaerothrix sp.]|uniref:hypothetical protein n=1 Tax=uncultured Thermanaerothrix sp. TaxID=1195149 RepID=UPI00263253BD|nr:hypothetical protein [uncultured Thermanaerothrix sp.]